MNKSGTGQKILPPFNARLFFLYLAFALIIPAITIVIEFLILRDPSFRASLQIDLENFHLYQLVTSSFVHADFNHFLGNVTAYLLIIIYGLVLATILNRKRLYLVLTKMIVLVFLLFGAAFALFNSTTTYYAGLSGIDAALAGLLLIFWLMYLEQKTAKGMRSFYGIVLAGILVLFVGITLRYMSLYHAAKAPVLMSSMVTILLCLFVLTVILFRHQFVTMYRVLKEFSWSSRLLTFMIIAILAYFIWNIFPESLGHSTRVTSISLHLTGVILGILVGYLFMIYLVRIAYFHGEPEVMPGVASPAESP